MDKPSISQVLGEQWRRRWKAGACGSVLCICFLRFADAVQRLADREHEPASGPQSPIVAAALAWLGLALHPCGSSGWPAGCSPQIACSLGTGPLGNCQSKSTGAGWAQSVSLRGH